jgi:hypothetical protein
MSHKMLIKYIQLLESISLTEKIMCRTLAKNVTVSTTLSTVRMICQPDS